MRPTAFLAALRRFNPATAKGFGGASVVQTLLANVSIQGANVLTGVITARSFGPPGRGELAAMITWPQFLAFCLCLGIPGATVLTIKRAESDAGRVFAASTVMSLMLGAIAAVAGVALMPLLLRQYPPETVRLARLFVLSAPLPLLTLIFASTFQGRGDFIGFNLVRLAVPLLTLLLLAAFAAGGRLTPTIAACCFVFAPLPLMGWAFSRLCARLRPRLRGTGAAAGQLFHHGLRFYGNDLLGMLASQLDRVFVISLLGSGETGVYVVALSLAHVVGVLPAAVASVLFPKACGRPDAEIARVVARAARVTTAATAAAALLVGLLGPLILALVYGSEFVAAAGPARLLLAEAVLAGTAVVLGQAFLASGRATTVIAGQAVGVAASVPLLLLLVPRLGLPGAAVALLVATGARLVVLLYCFATRLDAGSSRPVPAAREAVAASPLLPHADAPAVPGVGRAAP